MHDAATALRLQPSGAAGTVEEPRALDRRPARQAATLVPRGRMRLLVATDQWCPDRAGGVARVATDVALGLGRAGHEVVVLAPVQPGRPAVEEAGPGVVVHRSLARTRLPIVATDVAATARAARRLGHGFDALVAHTCTVAAGLVASRLDAPLVSVFHADAAREVAYLRGLGSHARGRALSLRALEGYLRRLELLALRRSARTIVLSHFGLGLVRDLLPSAARRTVVVGGAVDTSAFTPGDRARAREQLGVAPDASLVVTVRRLVHRMGLHQLVDAVARLGDLHALDVRVGGDGPLADELTSHAERLGVAERVRLLGRVSDDDLVLLLRAADLFVLPTAAYEGFGLVTAEALACGTPVVGTPVGATPELLAPLEPRLLAASPEPPDLARAIRRGLALAAPELRERCRVDAVARFSWDAVLPLWEDAIRGAARPLRAG